jgi:peptidoglycan hydrolase FlgJ
MTSAALSVQFDPAATQRPAPALRTGDKAAAAKSARQFEAQFVSQMFGHMFEGIKTDRMFGGGSGEEMFRSLMLDEYGKMVANRGNGIGIATQVQKMLLQHQEVQ